jgi:C1A family cysteine protease
VCVGSDWYQYKDGIFEGNDYCGGYTNHQIILTGWDDATGTWVLKNSWGD